MTKNPLEIQHWNAADFRDGPFDKVILPLGSLESHGRAPAVRHGCNHRAPARAGDRRSEYQGRRYCHRSTTV